MSKIKEFFADMYLWEKIVCGVAVVLFVVGVGLQSVYASQQSENTAQVILWNQRLSQVKQELINKKADIKEKSEKAAALSSDQIISSGGIQIKSYNKVDEYLEKFFKIATTYHSGKQYDARRGSLKKYATDAVFQDKYLFDPGKDNDGNSLVDQYGLNSEFIEVKTYLAPVSGSQLSGVVEVRYNSWYAQDGESSASATTLVYGYTYDDKTNKLIGMSSLGQEVN